MALAPESPASRHNAETEAVAEVRSLLDALEWPYKEEFPTGSGRIDFLLHDDHVPKCGIEIKPNLDERTAAREWADYLEQSIGYSQALQVPVLIGPLLWPYGVEALHHGGTQLRSAAALAIFGGRSNVGLLADVRRDTYYGPQQEWVMVLRGKVQFSTNEERSSRITPAWRFVETTNSQKIRRVV